MKKKSGKFLTCISAVVIAAALILCAFFLYRHFSEEKIPFEIISQPTDVTAENGYTAVFTINATGNKLTYLWQTKNDNGLWTDINKESSPELSLAIFDGMNNSAYRCIVTDKYNESITSDEVHLFVTEEHVFSMPLITKKPDCLNGGTQTLTCIYCSYKKNEDVPSPGHTFNVSEKNSYRYYECSVCAYAYKTDIVDYSALDEALGRIPDNLSLYYDSENAKIIDDIVRKLNSVVYGVKAYNKLSQDEADAYANELSQALDKLSVSTKDYCVLYVNSDNELVFVAPDGRLTVVKNSKITETKTETQKKNYVVSLGESTALLSSNKHNSLVLSAQGTDPTFMRTALGFSASHLSGIELVPDYAYCELYINGESKGIYLLCEGGYISQPDSSFIVNESFDITKLPEEQKNAVHSFEEALTNGSYTEICAKADVNSFARLKIFSDMFYVCDTNSYEVYYYIRNGKLCAGTLTSFAETCANSIVKQKTDSLELNEWLKSLWQYEEFRTLCENTKNSLSKKLHSIYSPNGVLDTIYNENKSALTENLVNYPLGENPHKDYIFVSGETLESNIEFFRNELSR